MNINEFRRIVDSINAVLTEGLTECTEHFEVYKQWLEEVGTELSKPKRKSGFLVPKTPIASRKLRKRTRQPAEPSLEEQGDSVHDTSVNSSCNIRKKRPALQDTNLDKSINRPRREASKVAYDKIKKHGEETLNIEKKIHQDFGGKHSADSTVKRMPETEIAEESQRPSKNRRLDETFKKLTVSICDISSLSVPHRSSSIDHDKFVKDSIRKKSNSFAINSDNPDTMDLSNKENNLTFNIDSTVCSPICKENNLTFNINDSIKHSPVCADVQTTVNHKTPIKEQNKKNTKSNNKKSESYDLTPGTSLLVEQKSSEILSNSDTRSIIQNSPKNVPNIETQTLVEHKTLGLDSALATHSSGQNLSNPSDVLVNGGEKISVDTIPILKEPVVLLTDVMITSSPNDKVISPILSNAEGSSKYGYKNSRSAKDAKSSMKKTTEVFSPYAKEPVRERVAAFERLNTLSEMTQEQETEQMPQMRVTRTKARAMAKAAAAAEASAINDTPYTMEPNNDLSKNIYSQNAWKAARKSVAKAIVRTTKKKKYGTVEEPEMSKENSMVLSSSKHFTPHYRAAHHTPLSSSNISNTSANSTSRLFNFGSSSKPKHMMGKSNNIVVGIDTFISKQVCKSTISSEMRELKEEEIKRKQERDEEARRKREEAMKKCVEERKRKREERMKKVLLQREAILKQKLDAELRQRKEKEEKMKLVIQEREDRIKEQKQQKKQQAQQKAAELEERRKLEVSRMAKLKEQEEEQTAKKKELEEIMRKETHEKDGAFRDTQAKLAQLNAQLLKEKQLRLEEKTKMLPPKGVMSETFDIPGDKKVPNPNNYEIDSSGSDSSDDETDSKRPIPHWARRDQRSPPLKAQFYRNKDMFNIFFACSETTPNIMSIFKEFTTVRQIVRTSSAVWRTPPRYSRLPKY